MKRLLLAITLVGVLSGAALAGEMPGTGASVMGEVPTVSSSVVPPPPRPGEMPGTGGSATSSETGSGLVTTVLLTIITLLGR